MRSAPTVRPLQAFLRHHQSNHREPRAAPAPDHLFPRRARRATTFEFLDASGNIERLDFFGNITAEVIGARIDDFNAAHPVNLPGVLNGNPINGGLGSPSATQTIGSTTVGGTLNPVGAIAADAAGNVFYLSIVTTIVQGPTGPTPQNALILSRANITTGDSTIVADLTAATVAASGGAFTTLTSVTGASFSPIDGKLYYVAHGGLAGTSKLFNVDVNAASVPAIQASVTGFAGTFNAKNIGPIAFDLRNNGTAILEAADNTGVVTGGKPSPVLFQVNFANTDTFIAPVTPSLAGKGITDPLKAIAFDPANASNNNVIGLTSAAAASQELRIDITTGAAVSLGVTAVAPGTEGNNPGGLTFDPVANDPFSGDDRCPHRHRYQHTNALLPQRRQPDQSRHDLLDLYLPVRQHAAKSSSLASHP